MQTIRERAQHKPGKAQEDRAVRTLTRLLALGRMWPCMNKRLWRRYSAILTGVQRETEEKRIADIVETKTTVLPTMPKSYLSARMLLFGEDEPVAAGEQERNTDPLTTRKLSKEWLIETEQRPAIKSPERTH